MTADGLLQPGMPVLWEASLGQPALWSVAAGAQGSVYASTGHGGRVFRIDANGRWAMAWDSGLPEVFAVASDAKGNVWAASSPNGGVYRLNSGRPVEVWHSSEKYIWAIVPAQDGSLFVATGEQGRIYKVDTTGRASVYYETGQGNVTALTLGSNGQLYAGTEPNGLVYSIGTDGKASILYDSPLPEIRAIRLAPSGSIYVAAMGGAVSTRSTNPTPATPTDAGAAVTAVTPTVITVTEAENAQSGARIADAAKTSARPAGTTTPSAGTSTVTETAGVDRSAIYRIGADRAVETLRTSKDDNVYDLMLDGDAVLFSTDDSGRVYRWEDGKTSLLAELGTGETTRLLRTARGLFAAVSNPARLVLLGKPGEMGGGHQPWYESPVHDSGSVARWGHVLSRPGGTGIKFQTRTGNAVRPDQTWSDWAVGRSDGEQPAIASPIARFIQWRAEWTGNRTLDSVAISYLPQNAAPMVRSVTASSVSAANAAKNAATAANSTAAYSVTVTDTGDSSTSTTVGPNPTLSRLQTTQTQVVWQADDPDGDRLVYALYFRPEAASEWQLIRSRMYENTLLLDPDVLADGRYNFKVVASDGPANAALYAKSADLVSPAILVDNTPPLVTIKQSHRNGMEADVEVEAVDATSPLKRAEYSPDAGWWQPLEATDGIIDTPREQFAIHLEKLKPGEHLVVIRVYDAAGNAGLAKVLLR